MNDGTAADDTKMNLMDAVMARMMRDCKTAQVELISRNYSNEIIVYVLQKLSRQVEILKTEKYDLLKQVDCLKETVKAQKETVDVLTDELASHENLACCH